MIESKEQVLDGFRVKAEAFLAEPNPANGIDFDDATVTLKRYVLSELHDQELASILARFQKMIRELDVDNLSRLTTEVDARLQARSRGSAQSADDMPGQDGGYR